MCARLTWYFIRFFFWIHQWHAVDVFICPRDCLGKKKKRKKRKYGKGTKKSHAEQRRRRWRRNEIGKMNLHLNFVTHFPVVMIHVPSSYKPTHSGFHPQPNDRVTLNYNILQLLKLNFFLRAHDMIILWWWWQNIVTRRANFWINNRFIKGHDMLHAKVLDAALVELCSFWVSRSFLRHHKVFITEQ